MQHWEDLTLDQQLHFAGWRRSRKHPGLHGPNGKKIEGVGLTKRWVDYCQLHPEETGQAQARWRASLAPVQWYPRPGVWCYYTHTRKERGGLHREYESGRPVRVVEARVTTVGDGYESGWCVEAASDLFGAVRRGRWVALDGELRPATPEERAVGEASLGLVGG